jgi:xanthine dehydrogenase accessory factor
MVLRKYNKASIKEEFMPVLVLLRGGGDLATGVALRLHRTGCKVFITELAQPLAVRRSVAFAQAVFDGEMIVEGITGRLVRSTDEIPASFEKGEIPVLIDPESAARFTIQPDVIVDGRMLKQPPDIGTAAASMVIGLGPGFTAGIDCHAVIETMRGHYLGRVYWQGIAEPDSGLPEAVSQRQTDRVLRAPANGMLYERVRIGDAVKAGDVLAEVEGQPVRAAFDGIIRGLLHGGIVVQEGMKIGDLDPRFDNRLIEFVSDKALAIGGGVLEAILSKAEFRAKLAVEAWNSNRH